MITGNSLLISYHPSYFENGNWKCCRSTDPNNDGCQHNSQIKHHSGKYDMTNFCLLLFCLVCPLFTLYSFCIGLFGIERDYVSRWTCCNKWDQNADGCCAGRHPKRIQENLFYIPVNGEVPVASSIHGEVPVATSDHGKVPVAASVQREDPIAINVFALNERNNSFIF